MSDTPPAVLIVGASREAEILRRKLGNREWPVIGAADCRMARAVVVAPHPFDCETMEQGLELAGEMGIPAVALLRPGWTGQDDDNWHRVADTPEAAAVIRSNGWRRILLAVGQGRRPAFENLHDCKLFIRRQGALSGTDGRHRILGAGGPFTVAGERDLFRRLQIDVVVAHDAGGAGGWPKIEAARREGLPVVLIDRPHPPDARILETPAQVISWLAGL